MLLQYPLESFCPFLLWYLILLHLRIIHHCQVLQLVLLGYTVHQSRVFVQWKVYISTNVHIHAKSTKKCLHNYLKLLEQPCCLVVHYLITHNVSSDQSPITPNRTNVTLYGVQPGEAYTVRITPYVLNKAVEKTVEFTFSE